MKFPGHRSLRGQSLGLPRFPKLPAASAAATLLLTLALVGSSLSCESPAPAAPTLTPAVPTKSAPANVPAPAPTAAPKAAPTSAPASGGAATAPAAAPTKAGSNATVPAGSAPLPPTTAPAAPPAPAGAPAGQQGPTRTPFFRDYWGTLALGGTKAPIGTVVEAINPRGEQVGLFTINTAGYYGYMRVYGEDTTSSPAIPGMRAGEAITFKVNGKEAVSKPSPTPWQNNPEPTEVDLSVGS